jgi:hypothetical protein
LHVSFRIQCEARPIPNLGLTAPSLANNLKLRAFPLLFPPAYNHIPYVGEMRFTIPHLLLLIGSFQVVAQSDIDFFLFPPAVPLAVAFDSDSTPVSLEFAIGSTQTLKWETKLPSYKIVGRMVLSEDGAEDLIIYGMFVRNIQPLFLVLATFVCYLLEYVHQMMYRILFFSIHLLPPEKTQVSFFAYQP